MGLRRVGGSLVVVLAIGVAIAQVASGAANHVYSVSLTLKAHQTTHKISGAVITKAPSEYCDTSKLRIRRVMTGKDKVVARVKPSAGKWRLNSPPSLRGSKVYAEVSRYQLPKRPVECLAARSPKVIAP